MKYINNINEKQLTFLKWVSENCVDKLSDRQKYTLEMYADRSEYNKGYDDDSIVQNDLREIRDLCIKEYMSLKGIFKNGI